MNNADLPFPRVSIFSTNKDAGSSPITSANQKPVSASAPRQSPFWMRPHTPLSIEVSDEKIQHLNGSRGQGAMDRDRCAHATQGLVKTVWYGRSCTASRFMSQTSAAPSRSEGLAAPFRPSRFRSLSSKDSLQIAFFFKKDNGSAPEDNRLRLRQNEQMAVRNT